MTLTTRQQLVLLLVIAVVAGGFLSYHFVFKTRLQEYSATKQEVAEMRDASKQKEEKYFHHSSPDTVVDEFKKNLGPLKLEYERNKRMFFDTKVKEGDRFPGFTFKLKWEDEREKLVGRARKLGIFIPENIGFGETVPPSEQVEDMLNQLNIAVLLLNTALDSKVMSVDGFTVGAPYEKDIFVEMFPFEVSVTGTVESVVDFMYNIARAPKYMTVNSYQWQSWKGNNPRDIGLSATLIVLAARLLDKKTAFPKVDGEDEGMGMGPGFPGLWGPGVGMGRPGGPEEMMRMMQQGPMGRRGEEE